MKLKDVKTGRIVRLKKWSKHYLNYHWRQGKLVSNEQIRPLVIVRPTNNNFLVVVDDPSYPGPRPDYSRPIEHLVPRYELELFPLNELAILDLKR